MKRTRLSLQHLVVAICLAVIAFPAWAQPPHANGAIVPGRLLVKFHDDVTPDKVQEILRSFGAKSERQIPGIGVHVLALSSGATELTFQATFKQLPEVEFAEVDRYLQPQSITPNDYYYFIGWQWGLPKISAPDAWSVTTGSSSIVVAVISTGVLSTHPDLQGKLVPGWNVYDNNSNTGDVAMEGTVVAGIIAADTNNSIGIAGVCWNCMIMPVRVTDIYQATTASVLATGITWAADHGARVATASFMCTGNSTVGSAAQYLQSKGGVLTVPAGDYGSVDTNPINPYIITVGATDQNDVIYSWSDRGSDIVLVAPGNTEATLSNGGYTQVNGTSVAAPFVGGVAALMLSVNPSLTPAQITSMLEQSADDLGTAGWDPIYGYGRLNALKAVNLAAGGGGVQGGLSTTTTMTSTLNPSILGQSVTFTAHVSPSAATGTVTFLDGTTQIGSATLSGGLASFSTTGLVVGTHSITAKYGGNSSYSGSTSSALTQTVNKISSSTSLTSSLNPSTSGQTVTFTATVSPSAATGTVIFFNGGSQIGSATLNSGKASFSTSSLPAGNDSITATYGGDSTYNGSTSAPLTQTVNAASKTNTSTSLTSSLNPSTSGQTVTFTATVSPSAATGTVTFFDGGSQFGSATLNSGKASFSTSSLSAGTHSITASYGGNANYNGSTSAVLTQTVNGFISGSFSITASPASSSIKSGGTDTFNITVTGSGGFSGTVNFSMTSSPSGATASFSPSTVTGSGSTTMSVPTGGSMTAPYTLTITATIGSLMHSTSVTMKVHP